MYFVDREKIEAILVFIDQQITILEEKGSWETVVEKAALERIAHTIIEAILDVGNGLIDGFIMRDPGSYEDIIDILLDEKVINDEICFGLKRIIPYRKKLVQEFYTLSHGELQKDFTETIEVLKQFSPVVRSYLQNELGPVSAFRN
jgi:uncharacterized protein YutE (UPF0331/DUF86 family)